MSDTEDQEQRKRLEQDIFGDEEEGLSDIEDAAPENEHPSENNDDEGDDDLERELAAADGEDLDDEPALPSFRRRDGGSSKPKRPRQQRASPIEEQEPEDPEKARQWRLNKAIDDAIKGQKKKRKRLEGDDLASFHDDEMHRLREDMKLAAFQDIDAKKEGKPATAKLRMLPHVEEQLMRSSLADSILESNMLEAVRLWLEPLPDKSLPALNIQRALFTALEKLPITSDHLRESGVGKVVFFTLCQIKGSKNPSQEWQTTSSPHGADPSSRNQRAIAIGQ